MELETKTRRNAMFDFVLQYEIKSRAKQDLLERNHDD